VQIRQRKPSASGCIEKAIPLSMKRETAPPEGRGASPEATTNLAPVPQTCPQRSWSAHYIKSDTAATARIPAATKFLH